MPTCTFSNAIHEETIPCRATGIRALRRAGFEGTEVCRVSGHKKEANLEIYSKSTEVDKFKMAISMQHGKFLSVEVAVCPNFHWR